MRAGLLCLAAVTERNRLYCRSQPVTIVAERGELLNQLRHSVRRRLFIRCIVHENDGVLFPRDFLHHCLHQLCDAGVYGMAGLMFELCENTGIEIEVVPGITAACSGGAVLGSPLTCDFAAISLSDLLTPWEVIEKRVLHAAQGDFAMALYNPASKKRTGHLQKVCDIILTAQPPETVCGLVRNIGREGEEFTLTTLGALRDTPVDMLTTVFIGNSRTKVISGRMITPRGYRGV